VPIKRRVITHPWIARAGASHGGDGGESWLAAELAQVIVDGNSRLETVHGIGR
jgi:hypothetical protein